MTARPRIDLDGVDLADAAHPDMVLAIFRYRTTEGLILLIPESADLMVPWRAIESARLDLASGEVSISFTEHYATAQNWLRGARTLTGRWVDRFTMRGMGAD